MNKIKDAFENVKADDMLKQNTLLYLSNQRKRREKRHTIPQIRYAAALAAFVAVFFGISGYSMLNFAVSYISIDVNPSVELALNRFDRVVEVSAYNNDGAQIIDGMDLKGKPYTEAIDELLSNKKFTEYADDDSDVNFTVVSDDKQKLIEGIQNCKGYGRYNSSCHGADNELHSQAHEYGISAGKYKVYLKLKDAGVNISIDDCRDMSVKQMYELLAQNDSDIEFAQDKCGGGQKQHKHKNGQHE